MLGSEAVTTRTFQLESAVSTPDGDLQKPKKTP